MIRENLMRFVKNLKIGIKERGNLMRVVKILKLRQRSMLEDLEKRIEFLENETRVNAKLEDLEKRIEFLENGT